MSAFVLLLTFFMHSGVPGVQGAVQVQHIVAHSLDDCERAKPLTIELYRQGKMLLANKDRDIDSITGICLEINKV